MKKVIILSICLILFFIFSYKKNVYASSDVINTLVITESDSDYDLNHFYLQLLLFSILLLLFDSFDIPQSIHQLSLN